MNDCREDDVIPGMTAVDETDRLDGFSGVGVDIIPGVTAVDETDRLDGFSGVGVGLLEIESEYAAKNLSCWRFNNFRPPQNSFGLAAQGILQELSSPTVGFATMEFPHVPYKIVIYHILPRGLPTTYIHLHVPIGSMSSHDRVPHIE